MSSTSSIDKYNLLSTDKGTGVKSYSQHGQDMFVLNYFDEMRDGYFVDLGASNPHTLSNTFMLESVYGWDGILVDGNERFVNLLKEHRSASHIRHAAIGPVVGKEIEFVNAGMLGGINELFPNDNERPVHKKLNARRNEAVDDGKTVIMTTVSLTDILIECNAPRTIHYMSIDLEGAEIDIVKSFNFNNYDIRVISIEHNFRSDLLIKTMSGYGYHHTKLKGDILFYKPRESNE